MWTNRKLKNKIQLTKPKTCNHSHREIVSLCLLAGSWLQAHLNVPTTSQHAFADTQDASFMHLHIL